jgi:hypothetical protein
MKQVSFIALAVVLAFTLAGCIFADAATTIVFGPDPATGAVSGTVTGTGGHSASIFYKTVSIDTDPNRVYVGETRNKALDDVKTGDFITISWQEADNGQRWITAITKR